MTGLRQKDGKERQTAAGCRRIVCKTVLQDCGVDCKTVKEKLDGCGGFVV